MSLAQYFQCSGPSGKDCIAAGFSNAVKLPQNVQLVLTAGQAGIDLSTGQLVESSPEAQIGACFDCYDVALKSAGVVDGLASAFKIISFLPDQRYDPLMMAIWRRRYPDHHQSGCLWDLERLVLREWLWSCRLKHTLFLVRCVNYELLTFSALYSSC